MFIMSLLDFELMLWFFANSNGFLNILGTFKKFQNISTLIMISHEWKWIFTRVQRSKSPPKRVEKVKKLRTRQEVMKSTQNRLETDPKMTQSGDERTGTEDKRDESKLLSEF